MWKSVIYIQCLTGLLFTYNGSLIISKEQISETAQNKKNEFGCKMYAGWSKYKI